MQNGLNHFSIRLPKYVHTAHYKTIYKQTQLHCSSHWRWQTQFELKVQFNSYSC